MNNSKNTNNPSNGSYKMQFEPLTKSGSSTPAPPFGITPGQIPLYMKRHPLFTINQQLLDSVNGTSFDIVDNGRGEGERYGYITHRPKNKPLPIVPLPQPSKPIENNSDWLYGLYNALNRIGINATTMILIILAVFIAVQFHQYKNNRSGGDINGQNNNNSYSKDEIDNMLKTRDKKWDNWLKEENNKTVNLIDLVKINKKNINLNKENITKSIQNNTNINNTIALIKENIENKINKNDPILSWFNYKETTNWISGVIRKPKIIPYYFDVNNITNINNITNNNNKPNPQSLSVVGAFKRGLELFHNETIKNKNNKNKDNIYDSDQLKYTANVDITDIQTSNTLKPYDCLQFNTNKNNRWIEIGLIEKMIPYEFEYIHINKSKINPIDWDKSPKQFMLYGKVRHGQWEDIQVEKSDKNILKKDESTIKLNLTMKTGIEFMRIEYDVNEDAKTTRLYRMRVHGKPDF